MSDVKIRVYEAARKLNLETADLMSVLGAKGVEVKSPIAFITQAEFDMVLDYLTGNPDAVENLKSETVNLAIVATPEKKEEVMAEVLPFSRPHKKQEPMDVEECDDNMAIAEAPSTIPPTARPERESGAGHAFISYIGLGLSAVAILAALMLFAGLNKTTDGLFKVEKTAVALNTQVETLGAGVNANRAMILENKVAVDKLSKQTAQMRRVESRSEINAGAVALDEMSTSAPKDMAPKLKSLADGLSKLASSL